MARLHGREAIRQTIAGWLSQMNGMRFRFGNILVLGDVSSMKRYDGVPSQDGTARELGDLGVAGLRDGQMAAASAYFDLAQLASTYD